jgi:hypothetical protein
MACNRPLNCVEFFYLFDYVRIAWIVTARLGGALGKQTCSRGFSCFGFSILPPSSPLALHPLSLLTAARNPHPQTRALRKRVGAGVLLTLLSTPAFVLPKHTDLMSASHALCNRYARRLARSAANALTNRASDPA